MITILEAGDWSGDGHGMTGLYACEHNLLSNEELEHAYMAGCAKLGFLYHEVVARDYEDNMLKKEHAERLADFGIRVEEYIDTTLYEGEDGHYFHEGAESYAKLWCAVAWLGRPDLRWSVRDLSKNSLKIGGYGMFFN